MSISVPAVGVEFVSTPNPHYIPGYTGHCPQLYMQIGKSYGMQTHKLFLDKDVPHSQKLVLSDRIADDYQFHKMSTCDVDAMNAKLGYGPPVKCHGKITPCLQQIPSEQIEPAIVQEVEEKHKELQISDGLILCEHLLRPEKCECCAQSKYLDVGATKIYHKQIGQLPNYGGHVPGEIFRFGKTYGCTTIDGKRWLRGDTT